MRTPRLLGSSPARAGAGSYHCSCNARKARQRASNGRLGRPACHSSVGRDAKRFL